MKRCLLLALLSVLCARAQAQTTGTVSGTVTDLGGQAWFGGAYTFTFKPPVGYTGIMYQNGIALTPTQLASQSGVLDGSGAFSGIVLLTTNNMTPVGAQWSIQVCPQATSPCAAVVSTSVVSGAQDISSLLHPPAIALNLASPPGPSPFPAAYSTTEIATSPIGGQFYNLTTHVTDLCTIVSGQVCTNWVAITAPGVFISSGLAASRPVVCNPGDIYIDTDDTGVFRCGPANTWVSVGGGAPGGSPPDVQINANGSSFGNGDSIPANLKFDPIFFHTLYIDPRAYHARVITSNAVPAIPGCTASINSGSNTATLSSACGLQNNDPVLIFGAGANNPISTPSAPTVTPTGPIALTGIDLDVASQTGSTTYNYCVAWLNFGNNTATNRGTSVTACSPVATITTGQATLGPQSVAISSITLSNNTFTIVLSAPQQMAAGMGFRIEGAVPISFNGFYKVATWTDSTHITALTTIDSREDAPTTATTPGTLYYQLSNQIVATAPTGSTDGSVGIVYRSGPGGGGAIGCVMIPQLAFQVGELTYDKCSDYGATYSTFTLPYYVPTTAPASATNEALSAYIGSGGGTTTITLVDANNNPVNAVNTVSGATILLDDAPAIEAALAAGITQKAPVRLVPPVTIPSNGAYVVNSNLTMPGSGTSILEDAFCNGLLLNATLVMSNYNTIKGLTSANCSTLQFDLNPVVPITIGRAYPGIYHQAQAWLENIQLTVPDGTIGIHGKGLTMDMNKVQFAMSGSGYTSIGYLFSGTHTGANTPPNSNMWNDVSFVGAQLGIGSMTTPAVFDNFGPTIKGQARLYTSGKTLAMRPPTSGGALDVTGLYSQGAYSPFVTAINAGDGPSKFIVHADNVVNDTTFAPACAGFGLTCNFSGKIIAPSSRNVMSGSTTANNVDSAFFSNPFGTIPDLENTDGMTSTPIVYQFMEDPIWGYGGVSRPVIRSNAVMRYGPGDSWLIDSYTPPAPSSCVVSAGGSVPVAAGILYTYAMVNEDGTVAKKSATCSATTTSGNQTVTVTWNAIVGGRYNVYRNGGRLATTPMVTSCPAGICTYVDTLSGTQTGSASQSPSGGNAGCDNSTGPSNLPMAICHTQEQAIGRALISGDYATSERQFNFPDSPGWILTTNSVVSDSFQRPGNNVTIQTGNPQWVTTGVNLLTSGMTAPGGTSDNYYTGTFTTAQFARANVAALSGTNNVGVAVNFQNGGSTNGYACTESTTTLFLLKVTNNSGTTLTSTAISGSVGDTLYLVNNPNLAANLSCSSITSSGTVRSVTPQTDATYTGGAPGIRNNQASTGLNYWSGGNLLINNDLLSISVSSSGQPNGAQDTGIANPTWGQIQAATYATPSNCAVNSVSPAACGSAAAGAFVVPTTTTTYTVNTTAVTAHSRIMVQPISFAADLPSTPTCVAPLETTEHTISAIVAATSFTLTLTSTTGQTCWYYWIVN